MKTKKGVAVPLALAKGLKSVRTRRAWDMLRPSCQSDYVSRVKNAETREKRDETTQRVLKLTRAYGARHADDHKSNRVSG
jgi:hypothetical protein